MSEIPAEAFAEAVAVLGRTGSGKTFAAKGAIETVLARGERVVVLDPTGVWWGLRSSADGTEPGFPVAVFGGLHGDVAITEASAAPLAQLIADRNLPVVVDVSELSMSGRVRFATAFLEQLYAANRRPLTIVFDEADLFAPQRPMPDQTVLLNRMETIVRRGRVRGFRPWMITQRPAELHKSVLSQAATLIAMKLTAPQDRDAIGAWIDGQADRDVGKKMLAALPKLARGEGFLWCPAIDFLERMTFPPITTFDSGRTPEHGESIATPERLADVDLSGVLEALKPAESPAPKGKTAATRDELLAEYARGREEGFAAGYDEGLRQGVADVAARFDLIRDDLFAASSRTTPNTPVGSGSNTASTSSSGTADDPRPAQSERQPKPTRVARTAGATADSSLPKAERLILTALAQYPDGRSKAQVAMLTGYSSRGGGFNNSISSLRTKAYLVGGPDLLVATAAGVDALGDFEPLPRGKALRDYWFGKLVRAERESLRALCDAHPRSLTKQQVANAAGYEASGGGFNNALSKLRTLDLIRGSREMKASPDLFT